MRGLGFITLGYKILIYVGYKNIITLGHYISRAVGGLGNTYVLLILQNPVGWAYMPLPPRVALADIRIRLGTGILHIIPLLSWSARQSP